MFLRQLSRLPPAAIVLACPRRDAPGPADCELNKGRARARRQQEGALHFIAGASKRSVVCRARLPSQSILVPRTEVPSGRRGPYVAIRSKHNTDETRAWLPAHAQTRLRAAPRGNGSPMSATARRRSSSSPTRRSGGSAARCGAATTASESGGAVHVGDSRQRQTTRSDPGYGYDPDQSRLPARKRRPPTVAP